MLFLSQAASVSLWQMLEVNSVSLSCSFLRHSCAVSSAGLCLLCWLSSGCRDAPVPLERLQALLMLEETRLWDVRRSLSSFCCLGTNAPEYAAWDGTFVVLLFCFFSQVFVHCHLGARGWQPSHQTDEWNILMISLKSFVTVYNTFAQNNSSVANCVTYEETFWKAVCLHDVLYSQRSLVCILLLHRMAVHVKTMRQRGGRKKWKYSKSLTPQITASISVVVTSVAALCLWRSAVSFFSAACVSVSRLRSLWHWVLWKSPLRTGPRTG